MDERMVLKFLFPDQFLALLSNLPGLTSTHKAASSMREITR